MSVALDFGTHELRSLRRVDERVVARRCRATFAALPDTPTRRRVLEKSRITYATCEDALLLLGDTAVEFAGSFRIPCRPLLAESRVPTGDAPARQVLASLVDALLPEPTLGGEICCVALPGRPERNTSTSRFLARLVELRGYRAVTLGRGHGAVLSTLVDESFTGVGIDFGAGTTDLSVVRRGVETARYTVDRGGDWIDARLAEAFDLHAFDGGGRRFLDTESARDWKEQRTTLLDPTDEQGEFLGEVVTEHLARLIEDSAGAIDCAAGDGRHRLPIVCSGGTTRLPEFAELLSGLLDRADYPIPVGPVRIAPDARYAVARGCLINAEIEAAADVRGAAA